MMQDVYLKVNPGLSWQKQHSTRRRLFRHQIETKFKEETSKMLHLEHTVTLYGVGTWTLRQVDKKYPESFEKWCWKKWR
jgi:hypothetical protein